MVHVCIYWSSVFNKFQGLKLNLILIENPNILIDCILHFQHDNFKLFLSPSGFLSLKNIKFLALEGEKWPNQLMPN